MTIDDQINDERIQYDVNREAAKMSALSSGKINKYEYLTDEEILPSNQKQIIEQAKFIYSPSGKAFEKQSKKIEDRGENPIKAIQNQGHVETIKKYVYDDRDSPLILKQKEIFNKAVDKKIKEITELNNEVSPDNLIYKYTGPTADAKSNELDNALSLIDEIRESETSLSDVKNDQKRLKSRLGEIKKETMNIDQKNKKM